MSMLDRTVVSGIVASLGATAALAVMARAEGKGALQPLNATSHWLNGEAAAEVTRADLRHTGVGYATHQAATLFWAALFEGWIAWRRPVGTGALVLTAAGAGVVAAAADYIATPKRYTPGWEFVLSKRAMTVVYAAMAAGLVARTAVARSAGAKG